LGLIDIDKIDMDAVLGFLTVYGVKFIVAIAIFYIGKWIIGRLVKLVKKGMLRSNVDETLVGFMGNILTGIGLAFVVIAALAQLGINTTSLAAVIAAAGLAIGLALQGSLSNFAAGFLIILFKFFKVGDYIEAGGTAGTVEEINIFTTKLKTPDNCEVIVPNGSITSDNIKNYSAHDTRRLDLVIGVAYDADLPKTKELLTGILTRESRVLKDPAPTVEVLELADNSVNFAVRPWVATSDFWPTRFDLMREIKMELDKAGIGIPFPQRDVHLFIEEGQKLPIEKKTTKKAA
jgi:small conductance mechanosensitive channel